MGLEQHDRAVTAQRGGSAGKGLAAKADEPSLIPGTHVAEREN